MYSKRVFIGIACLATGLLTYILYTRAPQTKSNTVPIPETQSTIFTGAVTQAKQHKIPETRKYTGHLEASAIINIHSPHTARISRVHKRIGDRVQKGQLLITLDDEEFRFTVQQKRAILEIKRAKLAEARTQLTSKAQLFKDAQEDFSSRHIALESYTKAKSTYELAKQQIKVLEAEEKEAELQLEQSKQELKKSRIRSPLKGIIAESWAHTGSRAQSNSNLLQIIQTNPIKISIEIPEAEIPALHTQISKFTKHTGIRISIPALQKDYTGKLQRIHPVIKRETGTSTAEILIKNPKQELKPGMYTEIRINLGGKKTVFLIPKAAILFDKRAQKHYLQRVQAKKILHTSITLTEHNQSFYRSEDPKLASSLFINPYTAGLTSQAFQDFLKTQGKVPAQSHNETS